MIYIRWDQLNYSMDGVKLFQKVKSHFKLVLCRYSTVQLSTQPPSISLE